MDGDADALEFGNAGVLVVTNFGAEPVALPAGATVLLSSAPLHDDGRVPTDVTVWARVP